MGFEFLLKSGPETQKIEKIFFVLKWSEMVRNNENNVFSCILVILYGFGHFQHFWFSMTTIILKSILKTFAFEIDMNRVYFFLYYVIYINIGENDNLLC